MPDGLLEALGEGFRGMGAVASPAVAQRQEQERANALPDLMRKLQVAGAARALDADTKFSEAVSSVDPSTLKTSGDVLNALKNVPLDVIASSPRAQAAVKMAGTMQQREAQQEQSRQRLQFQYDQLEQRRDAARQRAEDARLSAEERARHNLEMEKINTALANLRGANVGGGATPTTRDYDSEYAKLDDAGKTALDMQAWNYINKNILPYRKGSGGGADRNDPIIHRAGQIANSLGMTPEELSGKSAEFKSNAQALAFSTKKLNAVQATLESFHNNIRTWEAIAEGKAPELGGAKLSEIRDKLRKIDLSDVKTLNDWEIKVRQQFNDPAMVAYVTAAFTVAMDYSRIISSQGQSAAAVTEGARNEALKLVAAGYNKDARKALIGTLESDAAGQIKGQEVQVDRIRKKMGLKPDTSVADKPADKQPATSGPKVGDKSTSKSGKPIHWDGKQWVYD